MQNYLPEDFVAGAVPFGGVRKENKKSSELVIVIKPVITKFVVVDSQPPRPDGRGLH
jgi:hypothetical protein